MKLENFSDNDLVKAAQSGSEDSLRVLINRYKPLTLSLANKYFIRGQERDDIIQESTIALFDAIQSFDIKADLQFSSWAKVICERHIIDSIRTSEKKNNRLFNDAISIENISYVFTDDSEMEVIERAREEEKYINLWQDESFKANFSDIEWNVIKLRAQKYSYNGIAQEMNISYKAVDNALQRAKIKIKRYFNEKSSS